MRDVLTFQGNKDDICIVGRMGMVSGSPYANLLTLDSFPVTYLHCMYRQHLALSIYGN